jgi:hypothetical protein
LAFESGNNVHLLIADKIYTKAVDGKIMVKINQLTMKNNLDSNLNNTFSALFMVTK